MDNLTELLENIRQLVEIDKKIRIGKLSRGDSFNLFSELGLTSDEVHLHSAFIAMLLNPNASHGQGTMFLKSFVEMLNDKPEISLDTFHINEEVIVEIEKSIGQIHDEEGGRLDILVSCGNKFGIIIENKIYAGDQDKQLKRYWNYAQQTFGNNRENYLIIYLTLDGHSPSENSTCGLNPEDYVCLSYKDDILKWLNHCVALAVRQPLLRETVNQYIEIIKRITYNDMENVNEVLSIMSQEKYIDAVFSIYGNINAMIDSVLNNILQPQLRAVAEEKGLELLYTPHSGWLAESYAGWIFRNKKWNNFDIRMEFEKRGLGDLIIGFCVKNNKKRSDIECWDSLWKKTTTKDKNNQWWIYINFPQFSYWNNPEAMKAITDGKTMKKLISDTLDTLISNTQGLEV